MSKRQDKSGHKTTSSVGIPTFRSCMVIKKAQYVAWNRHAYGMAPSGFWIFIQEICRLHTFVVYYDCLKISWDEKTFEIFLSDSSCVS